MGCNCIDEVQKKLQEYSGDKTAYIDVLFVKNEKGFETVPGISAKYRGKKIDGTLKVKPTQKWLIPAFCPFCGKPIETKNSGNRASNKINPPPPRKIKNDPPSQ